MEFSIKNNSAKKLAFSYLELIISMGLVVMVVFLTTPFLVHMEKTTTAKFGEFRAYAKYVENLECGGCPKQGETDWFLYQNTRYGEPEYAKEDELCPWADDNTQICNFVLPNHVFSYKVHLYGAGGGGSMGYIDEFYSNADNIRVARGQGGSNGQFVTKADTLLKAMNDLDNSEVLIFRCKDVALKNDDLGTDDDSFYYINKETSIGGKSYRAKNCIGIGGKGSETDNIEVVRQHYSTDVKNELKKRFMRGMFDESKLEQAKIYYGEPGSNTLSSLKDYIEAKNNNNMQRVEEIQAGLNINWGAGYSIKPLNVQNVGRAGGDSFFTFDDNIEPAIAFGGKGAITYMDNLENLSTSDASEMPTNDFYYDGSKYIISGITGVFSNAGLGGAGGNCKNAEGNTNATFCSGSSPIVDECHINNKFVDKNSTGSCPNDSQKAFNFGAGGGGGAIVKYQTSNPPSTTYNGGRGAGGAVVIEWN